MPQSQSRFGACGNGTKRQSSGQQVSGIAPCTVLWWCTAFGCANNAQQNEQGLNSAKYYVQPTAVISVGPPPPHAQARL